MDHPQQTALSLCSGIGGLDLAWSAVTGGRTVGYVEREAYPASILLERMEDQALEPAPIWCGNFQDLDTTPFRGVDWVIAGLPCQPYSAAGRQLADADERAIWPACRTIIDEVGARFVFLENVRGAVRLMLPGILRDLASMGFDAEWCCVRASEVGASHQRGRLFVLAYMQGDREWGRGLSILQRQQREAHPDVIGGISSFPPNPDRRRAWSGVLEDSPDLAPALPQVRRMADGIPDWLDGAMRERSNRLRALGNAVVPLQGAYALQELIGRIQE